MRKVVLLSGFLLASVFATANVANQPADDELAARKATISYNTQKFKVQMVKIQIKQSKDLNQSVRLLKDLKSTVEKLERKIK